MANAANSPFVKHPALLALFAPRPPPPFKTPMPSKPMGKLTGIAQFTAEFGKESDAAPPIKFETPTQRKVRVKKEKAEKHLQILSEREKNWDPHNNPNATKDPYKTLFVARLSYELTEDDLRREFERYGRIREVKLIHDKNNDKSRGYAFIEFERSNDLKEAFQHADGHKLKGRRILVDVERGRTVKTWKPRKLGGGLGKTRVGPNNNDKQKNMHNGLGNRHPSRSAHNKMSHNNNRHSARGQNSKNKDGKYSNRRDKYRDRDYRDRDRRSTRDRKETERSSRNERDNRRKRSRSRSRERKERNDRDRSKRDRIKKENKDRGDRERDRGRNNENITGDRDRGRKERDRDNKDNRDRSRRRRSRSKDNKIRERGKRYG